MTKYWTASKLTSYGKLLGWAQYGEKHKRYWQKSLDTYEIPVKISVHSNGESAGTGEVIGGYELKSYDFTSLDKACAEWGAQVSSTLKIAPNGEKSNGDARHRLSGVDQPSAFP